MNKIIAIGDIHGRSIWKNIVAKEIDNCDKIIFMGDYFDTRDGGVSPNRQIKNFKDIVALKKANPDKVILLFGNHDFHYLKGVNENYSGYQFGYAADINEQIQKALNDNAIQMCYIHDKYVFTHAGITKTWAERHEVDIQHLDDSLNDLLKYTPNVFKFAMGDNLNQTGDDITQSPIWVRPGALYSDMIEGPVNDFVCVVGHTIVKKLGINPKFPKIILIDCLGTSQEYLVIQDGVPSISKINLEISI